MNTTKKLSKFIANSISNISTKVAYTSTKKCAFLVLEEPKMPKSLLKKAK
ncbi:cyclic lactone autoinducer peptide [Clostridium sp. ZS2-4]|nr:cyclic lactone autoinducer peptide [Clostridium sp. ZS2-4]MCY6355339.1 cyclic lactone autoinducer peptide [Clostridium sp. ZS2-4]